jgi:hypothetical protein
MCSYSAATALATSLRKQKAHMTTFLGLKDLHSSCAGDQSRVYSIARNT